MPPYGRADRDELSVAVQVVLGEFAGREVGRSVPRRRQHADELVRIRHTEPLRPAQFLPVLSQDRHGLPGKRPEPHGNRLFGEVLDVQDGVAAFAGGRIRHADPQRDLLQAQAGGQRRQPVRHTAQGLRGDIPWRAHVEDHPAARRPTVRRPLAEHVADIGERLGKHRLQMRESDDPVGRITGGAEIPHLGDRHQALVLRVLPGDGVEKVDVLGA